MTERITLSANIGSWHLTIPNPNGAEVKIRMSETQVQDLCLAVISGLAIDLDGENNRDTKRWLAKRINDLEMLESEAE